MAETPVARQLKASPLGLVAHAQVGIQRTVAGNAAVGLLPLPLIYKAHALGKQGTCTRRYVETPLDAFLVAQVGAAAPVAVNVYRITFPASRHGVVSHRPYHAVQCVCPVQIAAQTYFRVPRFQPYALVEGRLQAGISTGDVQRVAVVGQGKQVAQGRLPGVPLIGQLHPRLFPAPCHCKIGAVIAGLPDGVCLQHPRLLVEALPFGGNGHPGTDVPLLVGIVQCKTHRMGDAAACASVAQAVRIAGFVIVGKIPCRTVTVVFPKERGQVIRVAVAVLAVGLELVGQLHLQPLAQRLRERQSCRKAAVAHRAVLVLVAVEYGVAAHVTLQLVIGGG